MPTITTRAGLSAQLNTYHPRVDAYRDGGMGGLGADHSVVGAVAVSVLDKYRHHDGYWNFPAGPGDDQDIIDALRADLRAGIGFHTPLMLEYSHHISWAYLGEGNHRLAAARLEGVPVVPVRVVRSTGRPLAQRDDGVGAPARHHPIVGATPDYIPSDIHPDYLIL